MQLLLTRGRPVLVAAAAMLATACEYPTESPSWDMRWNVPVAGTSISVATLLPNGVSTTADLSAFVVSINPVTISRTLSQDCAQCVTLSGTDAPKPAFMVDQRSAASMPPNLNLAIVAGGQIDVVVNHDFTFDPIRVRAPGTGAQGSLEIIVRSAGQIVGRRMLHGDTATLPAGIARAITVPLTNGAVLGTSVEVQAVLSSPLGDVARIEAARQFSVTATPTNIRVSRADVRVAAQNVSSGATELDLSEIDDAVSDRVLGGNIILQLDNPFAVGGTMTLTIAGEPGQFTTLVRTFSLRPAKSTVVLSFTRDELRSMFGKQLTVTVGGPISGTLPSNIVEVLPSQIIDVRTRLDMTVCSKENACTP